MTPVIPAAVPVGYGWGAMPFLPREHGAYGQLAFPLVTAFASAGVSMAGVLLAAAVIAGFLAHEPAAVRLGWRGQRARRELGRRATIWLGCCLAVAVVAGAAALLVIHPAARWSIALPLAPALVVAVATVRGDDKSCYGEVTACLALTATAVPVSMAAGASLEAAAAIAIPFAVLFAASTLAVRVVILRVRGGGDPEATAATRRAALALVSSAAVTLAVLATTRILRSSVLVAAIPGLLTAATVAAHPPAPSRLRTIGWTLVAVSIVTSVIIVVAA